MYSPIVMAANARLRGWTLARAHARTGDPVAIASYMGKGSVFDGAITAFTERCADQNQAGYREFANAIKSGRVTAAEQY